MSASHEWAEYHLTPSGWVDGTDKHDFGYTQKVETPDNTVLSYICGSRMGSTFSKIEHYKRVVWRGDDEELIAALLKKYGDKEAGY
jgi:hypothetical protein